MGRAVLIPLKLEEYDQIPQEEKGYLAIQSTSVGMHPHTEDVIIEDEAFYKLIPHSSGHCIHTFLYEVYENGTGCRGKSN